MRVGRAAVLAVMSAGLMLLVPAKARAQAVGIEGGPALGSFSQPHATWASGTGLMGGLFLQFNESHRLGLTADVLYAEKRDSVLGSQARLQFFEVPILARVNLTSSPRHGARVYALAGPGVDFNFKATPAAENYNAVDVNAIVGAGVQVSSVLIEARESIGLRQLEPNTPALTARVFTVTFGVRLR